MQDLVGHWEDLGFHPKGARSPGVLWVEEVGLTQVTTGTFWLLQEGAKASAGGECGPPALLVQASDDGG